MLVLGWLPAFLLWQYGMTGLGAAAPSTSSTHTLSATIANTGPLALMPQNGLSFGNGTFAYGSSDGIHAGATNKKLNDRDVKGIYICQLPNWGGNCFWTQIDPSIYTYCMIVTSNGGWASVGPDPGLVVQLYRDDQCKVPFWWNMTFPGDADVPAKVASAGVAAVTNDWFGAVFRAPL